MSKYERTPPVNSTAISIFEPGAPCIRNFGLMGKSPLSMKTFWPCSVRRNSMNARAAFGCFAPARMAMGSGVTNAFFGATNLMSKPETLSSNATYEVMLQSRGEAAGWEWLKKLADNTGHFTARSRDVPNVVAKGEFAAGFAVPSYMAFEEKVSGFDIKFVSPKNAFVTPEPMAILAGSRHPKAAHAFIEFLLTEQGQKVFMESGLFPISPKFRMQGAPGSKIEMAVEFTGGVRSYFDNPVSNVYDEDVAKKRSEQLKERYRKDIEATWKKP